MAGLCTRDQVGLTKIQYMMFFNTNFLFFLNLRQTYTFRFFLLLPGLYGISYTKIDRNGFLSTSVNYCERGKTLYFHHDRAG
jgi:hypothetical protein